MRTLTLLPIAGLLLASAGCPPPGSTPGGPTAHTASAKGLVVEMILPRHSFYRGQIIPIRVVARNTTGRDMVIEADSGALVYIAVWRRATGAWERVRRYPEAAVMVVRPWKLQAGQAHTFPMNVKVAPDWPTGELLRLTAELNGRPDVVAEATIDVYPTREAYEKASPQ